MHTAPAAVASDCVTWARLAQDFKNQRALHKGHTGHVTLFYGNGALFRPHEFKPGADVVTTADVRKQCRQVLQLPSHARTSAHLEFLYTLTKNSRLFNEFADEVPSPATPAAVQHQ